MNCWGTILIHTNCIKNRIGPPLLQFKKHRSDELRCNFFLNDQDSKIIATVADFLADVFKGKEHFIKSYSE